MHTCSMFRVAVRALPKNYLGVATRRDGTGNDACVCSFEPRLKIRAQVVFAASVLTPSLLPFPSQIALKRDRGGEATTPIPSVPIRSLV